MPLAEDRTEQYIRFHLSDFFRIDVLEILSHLPCLTVADQDKLRAYIDRHGNRDSVWKLFDHLRKRTDWVNCLIRALTECELTDLAEVVANVYATNQARFQTRPGGITAPVPPSVLTRSHQVSLNTPPGPSAGAPGPHPPASGSPATHPGPSLPDTTYNGYPEELERGERQSSHTAPIQDTQPPESKSEVPRAALNPASSGDTSRNPHSSPGHSSFSAPAPTATGKHRKASGGSGDSPPASASLPPPPRGPVSPSVSFVPHSKKAGPTSGPRSLPSPPEASFPRAAQDNENQPTAASPLQGAGLPASREPPTRILGPQKVPPLAPKFPSPVSQVPPGPAPSGQVPLPHVQAMEVSKPGVLHSCDDQPYSGGSERLLISSDSGSKSLHISSSSSVNLPEENDYFSVTNMPSPGKPEASGPPEQVGGSESPSLGTIVLHVDERPSEGLLGSGPGVGQTPGTAAQPEVDPSRNGSWAVWLGSAVAVAFFSVALALIYKRIKK
ncbi:mitochondrial antiviral-signaling protein isoform X2 [Phascolarctos cinereus]|uniref:Mitochondrial antiviral-signaling protein n=1 Tax=Phascolarctos cinereus TaxID=38626 RepID=A0A6P5LJB8_PHACI|nr:mitochondrial antiviral-signaling protein isoform X2 [Phascolarctos cinereus]